MKTLEALEPVNVKLTEAKKVLEQLEVSSEQVVKKRDATEVEVNAMIDAANGRAEKQEN